MKKKIGYLIMVLLSPVLLSCTDGKEAIGLKDAYKDKFYIGVALNKQQFLEEDVKAQDIIKTQFNSVVAENDMKNMFLQPREGEFFFENADKFVAYAEANNMHIVGHTLIWHSQAPRWFFVDEEGNDVSREVLIERMRNHISTVVGRYKGRIKGWDVVNEAIEDNGEWRNSKFYRIIGEDFIKLAFQFAREADPDAELYYNDYSMFMPGRRATVVRMIKSLQEQGVKIDGIGMQGHVGLDYPELDEFEKSILAFAETGVKIMITEMEISALPSPKPAMGANISDNVEYQERMNPYKDRLPAEAEAEWENRYLDFFKLYLKHADKIDRVTLWGLSDLGSWKNDFPIRGRTDYPLLFDRNYEAKPIVNKLKALVK